MNVLSLHPAGQYLPTPHGLQRRPEVRLVVGFLWAPGCLVRERRLRAIFATRAGLVTKHARGRAVERGMAIRRNTPSTVRAGAPAAALTRRASAGAGSCETGWPGKPASWWSGRPSAEALAPWGRRHERQAYGWPA